MDSKNIFAGEIPKLRVQKAIDDSHLFLAFLSPHSVNQVGSLQQEIRKALDQSEQRREDDIYLIPVHLEPCDIPYSLPHIRSVNLFSDSGWEQLVAALKEGLRRLGNDTEPGPPPQGKRIIK